MGLNFDKLDSSFDYRLNKCWAKKQDDSGKPGLNSAWIIASISEIYILGDETDEKEGCTNYEWVVTQDQADYTTPTGFIRPNSITFPVFSVEDQADALVIECQIFLCENNSDRSRS